MTESQGGEPTKRIGGSRGQDAGKGDADFTGGRRVYTNVSPIAGLYGLQKAGAAALHSDEKIRKAAARIMARGHNDPLQRDTLPAVGGLDLETLFQQAARERIDFLRSDEIAELIRELKRP